MITENTDNGILITGTADNDSIINFGDDVTIDSGSGNDTIYSGLDDRKADRVSINAGEGNNVVSIQGGSDSVTIRTGDGNNLIGSTSPNNAVFSGAGNDSVVFYTGSDNNTVEKGDGDDVIDAVGHNVTINAGSGNDKISTYRNAYDITIKPGTGDDDITLGGPVDTDHTNVVQYADGDGNDTISTFSATDTLQITSGSISGASRVGNNVEISVGSGKITLVEANDMNINIVDADGILHQTIFSGGSSDDTVVNDTLIAGTDGDDYLINDKGKNVTINAFAGNDTIDNTGDNSIIDAGAGNDIVSVAGAANVTIRTGEGDNRVYTDSNGANELVYFGNGKNTIVTSNRRTTIIGGSGGNLFTFHNGSFGSSVEAGSGNDTIQVGHYDITVDAGDGNDLISLYRDAENALIIPGTGNDTITVYNNTHAQTFQYSGGNDLINGFKSIDTLKIVGPTSANTIVSDGNLIFDFGDGNLTLAGVSSVESLNVEYLNKWSTIKGGFVYSGHASNNYAKTADVSLIGSELKDTNGDGAPDNISVNAFNYSSITGVMAFMSGFSGEVTLNGKDVGVIGDDDYEVHFTAKVIENAPANVIAYTNTKEVRGISTGATVNPNESDMVGFDSNAKAHVGDVTKFLLYNKNHKSGGSPHATIGIDNNGAGADLTFKNDILTKIDGLNDGYSATIVGSDNVSDELKFKDVGSGSLEFTSNIDDTVKINFSGTSSAQTITGSGNSVKLIGSSDDDLLIAGATNTTLTGGEGNDTFRGGAGLTNCVITDYTEGEDVIYHSRPFAAFSLLDGTKSVGDDYISEAGTATFKYLGGANKKIKFVDVNGDVAYFGNYLTIRDVDADTVTASEKVKVLDASERTKAIEIVGNTLDNTIYAGTGNDTLTGGDGADLFVYSAGNDVITDYTTNDNISLGAAITSTSLNGSDVVLMFGNNSLTIQNAKDKTLNLIDSSGVGNATVISVDTTQVFSDLVSDVTTQASNVESIAAETTTTLNGGEAAIIAKTSADVNITASAGKDTIISQGENVHVSLTGGNTLIFPLDGKITLENYDASTGSGFGTPYENIFSAVEDGSIDFNNGYLNLDSAQVYMDKSSELMNFYNSNGRQQKVGFASGKDSLDASNETKNLILVAKENGTIIGGTGNDTIFANEGSFVDGGSGRDLIKSLDGNSNIVLNERTTVEGFHTGWGDGSDTVYINDKGDPAVDFKADGLTFYDGGDIMTLSDVTDTAKVNLYYANQNALFTHVFIADDDWYNVSDGAADYYVGATAKRNHGIDFSGVTKDINVTMNTDYNSTTAEFWVNNIHSIKGGAGLTTITGSDKNDTIQAGTGETSINGGAGHDKMFGNTSANKNVATFYYTPGDGRDSIENFDFMENSSDATADKVKLDDSSNISEVFLRGSDVMIKVDDADGFLMLEDAKGKSFRLNDDLIAKVDTNVKFDGFTNCYSGIGERATLTVGKNLGNVEVWLSDDSLEYHGKIYDGNFAVLDASQSDGNNILAGNELNNVITGGSSENSLWGGYGSESDTLIGGVGQNTFFYGAGNGNDNIQNAHDGDIISLEDITLDQIADAKISAGGVAINFTDGGSLTVDGTADVTYQLADGSKYSANHSTYDWDSK